MKVIVYQETVTGRCEVSLEEDVGQGFMFGEVERSGPMNIIYEQELDDLDTVNLIQLTKEARCRQIEKQRAMGWPDFHPETYCHRCGRPNIPSWSVDSALWNQAAEPHEILCPICFVTAYEERTGLKDVIHWRLIWEGDDA